MGQTAHEKNRLSTFTQTEPQYPLLPAMLGAATKLPTVECLVAHEVAGCQHARCECASAVPLM